MTCKIYEYIWVYIIIYNTRWSNFRSRKVLVHFRSRVSKSCELFKILEKSSKNFPNLNFLWTVSGRLIHANFMSHSWPIEFLYLGLCHDQKIHGYSYLLNPLFWMSFPKRFLLYPKIPKSEIGWVFQESSFSGYGPAKDPKNYNLANAPKICQ